MLFRSPEEEQLTLQVESYISSEESIMVGRGEGKILNGENVMFGRSRGNAGGGRKIGELIVLLDSLYLMERQMPQ